YLPTGYLPTGYLPIGAAAGGGGSLRGKSAAAATLSMATSPAVTIMTIFMMLIPLCLAPRRADRVTPPFPSSVPSARFYHPMFRLNRRGKWLPTICRFGDGMVQMRLGGSGRTQINQMVSRQHGRQRWRSPGSLPPFFYPAPACAYLTTADAPNVLLVLPASVA